jgi:hypothetical protein
MPASSRFFASANRSTGSLLHDLCLTCTATGSSFPDRVWPGCLPAVARGATRPRIRQPRLPRHASNRPLHGVSSEIIRFYSTDPVDRSRMEVMIVERIAALAAGVGSTNRRAIALQDVVATGTFAAVGGVGVGWLHGAPACPGRPRSRHRIRSAHDPRPRVPKTMPHPTPSRTALSTPCRAAA